jgi:hypothetical protein
MLYISGTKKEEVDFSLKEFCPPGNTGDIVNY